MQVHEDVKNFLKLKKKRKIYQKKENEKEKKRKGKRFAVVSNIIYKRFGCTDFHKETL